MAWKRQNTHTSVSVDCDLADFSEEQLLQGLIDAKWVTEQEAEALRLRKAKDEKTPVVFAGTDVAELDEARDFLRRGNRSEAVIHLERFLGREWSGMLQ
jgi:hypothetical protein